MSPAIVLVSICSVFVFLFFSLRSTQSSTEPREVSSPIPVLGHIIGILRHSNFYYGMLRDRCNQPIFTVPILGSKIHIVTSPHLISSVQRTTKTLAFAPISAKFTKRLCGSSAETNRIIDHNLYGEHGDQSYVRTFVKAVLPSLMPGPALDAMNRLMVENIASSMDTLSKRRDSRISLSQWLRHEITLATTNAVYDPSNPFKDPEVENAFWTFERGLMPILMNIYPSITARPSLRARDTFVYAFQDYFNNKGHLEGSSLVQARYDHSRNHNVPILDIARFEIGGAVAALVNTYTTAFWFVYYVYSTQILEECREEIRKITTSASTSGGTTYSIDVTRIKQNCPVLTSSLQEVLRHRSIGTAVREVVEDTLLDRQYLLRKGSTLLIPSNVIHSDPQIWGNNASAFDHKRFIRGTNTKGKSPNPIAFRAFGGGSTLCPGRHFATTEIMAITCMMIARFDLSPVGGEWPSLASQDFKMWAQIMEPDESFEVNVHERTRDSNSKWEFTLSDSEALFAMTAEDS